MPAYRALARAYPGHYRILAAPAALHPAAALVPGAFDACADAAALAALPSQTRGAAIGVNLHGRGPQSHRVLLGAGARRLVAFRHPEIPESRDGADWRDDEHEVARWRRMLAAAGIASDGRLDISVPDLSVPKQWLGATVLHPGAASGARRWPPERFAAVARTLADEGANVVVSGGAAERPLAARVVELAGLPGERNLAGRTSLLELARLIAGAGRVICGDTGVAHLATAYATPSELLFGPVAPALWGPPPRAEHRVLWSGATGDPHAERIDPGLAAIGVDRVLDGVRRLPPHRAARVTCARPIG